MQLQHLFVTVKIKPEYKWNITGLFMLNSSTFYCVQYLSPRPCGDDLVYCIVPEGLCKINICVMKESINALNHITSYNGELNAFNRKINTVMCPTLLWVFWFPLTHKFTVLQCLFLLWLRMNTSSSPSFHNVTARLYIYFLFFWTKLCLC